jgi:hypothetical protein
MVEELKDKSKDDGFGRSAQKTNATTPEDDQMCLSNK